MVLLYQYKGSIFYIAGRRSKSEFQLKKSYFEIPAFQSHIVFAGIWRLSIVSCESIIHFKGGKMDRRKKNNDDRIEPMPRKLFLELMREFKKSGGKYIASKQSEDFLDSQGAEASAINATTILFRRRPTRAAVYEELFHVLVRCNTSAIVYGL